MSALGMIIVVAIVAVGLVLSANADAVRRDVSLRRWRRASGRHRLHYAPSVFKTRRAA